MLSHLALLPATSSLTIAEKALPFWDLARWDAWNNTELVQTTPEAVAAGTFTDPQSPDASMVFPSVWQDAASGQWRMIYSIK